MGHSIRGRLILVFIGLAVGPLLVIAILLAWLDYTALPQPALTGVSAPAVNPVAVTLILAVVMAGIAGALGFLFARRIVGPILALTESAGAIGDGDLTSPAQVVSDDEIGILAGTFNRMVRQLRDRTGALEHSVADRTKALATFAKVSRLSGILDEKQLAAEVVEQVRNAFNYYHAQIFFFDPTGENLILAGGSGEAGRILLADGYKLTKGQGLAGRAAESNAPVLAGDTSQDPGWLRNPLLPKTRSEVAVPIAVGDQVLGVLDAQHTLANGMTQADADLLQSIASQVAVAVRHARLYLPVQQVLEREARIASISRKIRETKTVEDALQVTVCELGRALDPREIRVVLSESPQAGPAESVPDDDN